MQRHTRQRWAVELASHRRQEVLVSRAAGVEQIEPALGTEAEWGGARRAGEARVVEERQSHVSRLRPIRRRSMRQTADRDLAARRDSAGALDQVVAGAVESVAHAPAPCETPAPIAPHEASVCSTAFIVTRIRDAWQRSSIETGEAGLVKPVSVGAALAAHARRCRSVADPHVAVPAAAKRRPSRAGLLGHLRIWRCRLAARRHEPGAVAP
jgi:hypothetical protein